MSSTAYLHGFSTNLEHNDKIRDSYGRRAPSYDDASGGWHITLGQDFVNWLDPQPGETALDLACGTGLVTIPLAKRLGPEGRVVAVDITPQMIQVGQERLQSLQIDDVAQGMAPIVWVTADITSEELFGESSIRQIVDRDGGFDIISVCSALVLLQDQRGALLFWAERLLKKGGRLIVDVPTEDLTLQFMMTYHLPVAIGLSDSLAKGRNWIRDQHSLQRMLEEVGLTIEQSVATDSYPMPIWYDSDDATGMQVLEKQIADRYPHIAESGKSDGARKVWPELWRKATVPRPGGGDGVQDAHRLYVCVGRKS